MATAAIDISPPEPEDDCIEYELNNKLISVKRKYMPVILNPTLEGIREYPSAIQYITDPSEELCLAAIDQNIYCFKLIPVKYHTRRILLEALKRTGDVIRYMDNPDYELQRKAVEKTGTALQHILNQDSELCLIAVHQDPMALVHVLPELMTMELCLIAVKKSHRALAFVLLKFRTYEICRIAMDQDIRAFKFVPAEWQTERLCSDAVSKFPHLLDFVSERFLTKKFILQAVEMGASISNINPDLLDYEICLTYITLGGSLCSVPDKFRDDKMCLATVKFRPTNLANIMNPTMKLCQIAVELDGHAIQYVPLEFHSEELYWTAIKQSKTALKHIPKQNQEFYIRAVRDYSCYMLNVPVEFQWDCRSYRFGSAS